ncbi:hypothetical protein [uncultured Xanthomonas sp.]|uniref:hypothetical protein n=1 Tax=uncultured Xanthomonas sp. TaxID=152831 RepID=UPI0025E2B1A5|nr:hypothetical protein [uncultured Xanthomonas sp.]
MNPHSRAHRILRGTYNFTSSTEDPAVPKEFNDVSLGKFIGIYHNKADSIGDVAFFFDGLAWAEGSMMRMVRYDEMARATVPQGKNDLCVLIQLIHGGEVLIPVTGTDGRFFDTMQVIRFINRVVEDLDKS